MTNNYTCVIVDDEQDAIELLSGRLSTLFKNITITGAYQRWEEALEVLRTQPSDLLFLDISMPGKTGIDFLKLLPGLDSEIIFVTAHDSYALNAFAFSTSGYILKPIDDAELAFAINKALGRVQNKRLARQNSSGASPSNKLGIPNNHGIDYVNIDEILYLESTNKCTKLVTTQAEYTSSNHLGKFKNLVDNHGFFQVHRSFIVNLNSILRYESSGVVIMTNKKRNTRSS